MTRSGCPIWRWRLCERAEQHIKEGNTPFTGHGSRGHQERQTLALQAASADFDVKRIPTCGMSVHAIDGDNQMDDKLEAADSIFWTIAKAIGDEVGYGAPIVLLHLYNDISNEVCGFDPSSPPNPLFLSHGFDDTNSPRTARYMMTRTYKNIGGKTFGAAGTLASQFTQVDASGILMHSNATGSTLAHMKMLHGIARKYPRSTTVQNWVKACMTAKGSKVGIRGTQLAGAAIPIGAVGISTSVAAALGKLGVKLTYGTVINRVAMELHWRANVEMRIGGGSATAKPTGPASAVVFEILRKRGFTRSFGQYNVPALISESGGWWALRDKLLLM